MFVAGRSSGRITSGGQSRFNEFAWVSRLDGNGVPLWTRTLTGDPVFSRRPAPGTVRVIPTRDGAVYLTATMRGQNGIGITSEEAHVVRVGGNGSVSWRTQRDDLHVDGAATLISTSALSDDGVVVAGDGAGADQARLFALDPDGATVADTTIPLARVDACAGILFMTPGEVAFQVAGESSVSPGSLSVVRVDTLGDVLGTTTSTSDVYCHAMRARFDGALHFDLLTAGTPAFGADPFSQAQAVTASSIQSPFATRQALGVSVAVGRDAGWNAQELGWGDSTGEYWWWVYSNGTNSLYTALVDVATVDWTGAFNGATEELLEQAVDVEIIDDALVPDSWHIAVLARAEYDVDLDGVPDPDVPWLAVLDSSGDVISETVLTDVTLPRTEESGALAAASDGELFVGVIRDGLSRVAKVSLDGTVRWVSRPIASGFADSIEIAALEDGGVVAACADGVLCLDATGALLWRQRIPSLTLVGLAARGDRIALVTRSGAGPSLLSTSIRLDVLDLGGGRVFGTTWDTEAQILEGLGGSVAPLGDGGWSVLAKRTYYGTFGGSPVATQMLEVLGFDRNGTPLWRSGYGGLRDERASSLTSTSDGGVLVSGATKSVTTSQDAWLLRLDSCGRISGSCAAEFERRSAEFEFETTTYIAGERLDTLNLDATFDVPGALTASPVDGMVTSSVTLEETRQCSGSSKDTAVDPDDGTYDGLADLNVVISGTGSGRVQVNPPGATCDASCVFVDLASQGDTVQLTAFPDTGSSFGGYSGADSVDGLEAWVTFGQEDRTVVVQFD